MRKEKKQIGIDLLRYPELNSRIHPEPQINEFRRGLKKWGQYKNIVVDENNLILAGSGLVEAMRLEGYKKADAVVLYELTEREKQKLMLADNKIAGLGIDNLKNIETIISELDGDFDIPGFDDDVLKSIIASSAQISEALDDYGKATEENLAEIEAHAGANEEGEGNPDMSDLERKSVICPKCGAEVWL